MVVEDEIGGSLLRKPLYWCWDLKPDSRFMYDLEDDGAGEMLPVYSGTRVPWHFWAHFPCLYPVPHALLYISLSPCL